MHFFVQFRRSFRRSDLKTQLSWGFGDAGQGFMDGPVPGLDRKRSTTKNMRTHTQLETEEGFAGGKRDSGGTVSRPKPGANVPLPCRSLRPNLICCVRSLLFNCLASPLCLLLFSLLAACSAAPAQGAIEAWVQRFDAQGADWLPPAMAMDANGDVLISSLWYGGDPTYGGTHDDWVTLKYSGGGVPLWTNYYNGPGNTMDMPHALAVDASGNVFVTGVSVGPPNTPTLCAIIKYSPDGIPLWTRQVASSPSGGRALALDAEGNVFVIGQNPWEGTPSDILTMKYSSAGDLLWTRRYNGPADTDDSPAAVATDVDGNVVVAGLARGAGQFNSVTIKYSSAGVLLWATLHSGNVAALALDSKGNVVVTGNTQNATNSDYATVKYSNAGVPLWTNYYDGPANGFDQAMAAAVDANGNVVVTGESRGSNTLSDYATIKYSSAGVALWTNRYDGPENWVDAAWALALDTSGNVFVTGYSTYRSKSNSAFATVAYSSSGVPLWTKRYDGPGNYVDQASTIAVDGSGSVYVTGVSGIGGDHVDTATVKYVVAPIITRQPLSCTNAVGSTACFTVEAVGGTPLNYYWRRDGTSLADGGSLSGVTTPNLSIANVQLEDACDYTVVVTNEWGSTTSTIAHLTVVAPPSPGRFTNLSYSPATGFSFIFRDGTVGQHYRIQRSPSTAEDTWVDWQSFTYTEPNAFMDLAALTTTNRYYRAVSP